MLIPRYTSVLVRRIPGGLRRDRHPIVIAGGIPKSMLMATPDALPSGDVAVLKPNEGALEKEMTGMPSSSRSIGEVPPELKCPLCKQVMKDGVITSKCCFSSFCDKCIRDYTISKSMCVCGATGVLADDLLPNKTLRDTINRILEHNNNSSENGGSAFQAQDMESRNLQAKVASPAQSAASKGQQVTAPPPKSAMELDKGRSLMKVDDDVLKEAASQRSAPLGEEQKPCCGEAEKKKKIRLVPGGAAEMQGRAENYMMQAMGPCSFNPCWNGMYLGFMLPYGGPMPPYMGYMNVGFGCILPNGGPPQSEVAEFNTGGEDFGAHKSGLKWKEREYGGEHVSSTCKSKSTGVSDRSLPLPSSKKKSEYEQDKHYRHQEQRSISNKRLQPSSDKAGSVLSRICFPDNDREDERHFKRRASDEEHRHSRARGLRDRERPIHTNHRCTVDSSHKGSMHRPTVPCSF